MYTLRNHLRMYTPHPRTMSIPLLSYPWNLPSHYPDLHLVCRRRCNVAVARNMYCDNTILCISLALKLSLIREDLTTRLLGLEILGIHSGIRRSEISKFVTLN